MIKIKDRECYQYHKDTLENYESTKHLDVFNITENRAISIRDALLEYRRENNIYEVGDDVVFCNFLKGVSKEWLGETFKVIHVYEDGDVAVVSSSGVSTHLTLYTIKHATDAEVLAGHRLPSIQVIYDKDIPPNTIALER